jgi:transcriptional regulator with XRE-family HTH domain
MTIDFVSWLRSERLRRDLDIRDLAALSHLSTAQISRIETGKSILSLNSMIRLTSGLGVDLKELASRFKLKAIIPRKNGMDWGSGLNVTAKDAWALWNYYREEPKKVKDIFIAAYDKIRQHEPNVLVELPRAPTKKIVRKAINPPLKNTIPLFYPEKWSDEYILPVFRAGGLVTLRDLGTFVRDCRQKKGVSLRDTTSGLSISHQTLFRFEQGQIDRVSFAEVLELESVLEQEGILLGLAWRAGEFQTGILFRQLSRMHGTAEVWNDRVWIFSRVFITIVCWYMVMLPEETEWINQLREDLRLYIERGGK